MSRIYADGENYSSDPSVSQSQLKELAKSPRRYEAIYITKTMRIEASDAMEFGTLVHTMTLQPHEVDREIAVIPVDVLTSNGQRRGKAWDAFVEEQVGKILVKQADYDRARQIAERVWDHPFYKLVFDWQQYIEVPIKWVDPTVEVACKGIPDIVCNNEWIIDIKTTSDLTGFTQGRDALVSRTIADFGYHIQAAFYLTGASEFYGERKTRFALIVVETKEPYRVYAMEINQAAIAAGEGEMIRLLQEYKRRLGEGDWSEEGERCLLQVGIPAWAL
jgi:hypothetical protein